MGVVQRYTDWRALCAARHVFTDTFTFFSGDHLAGTLPQPSWLKPGLSFNVVGSSNNDGALFEVASVDPVTHAIYITESALTFEVAVPCGLHFVQIARDGYEEWPGLFAGQAGRTNLVRANGFAGGFSGIPGSAVGQNFLVSVNGQAPDAVAGVDEYDWYLSQRTDDPAKQWLSCATAHFLGANTYSGTVLIATTALANAELGLGLTLTVEQQIEVFRFCHLYCRRRPDGAIQWVDLLKGMFAG